MKPIKAGIIGMGYIGVSHIEAVRRIGFTELVAVADVNYELAERKAAENNVPRCYRTVNELLADPEIQVVHNCTPNHLHTEINIQIIEAGKHVFSEKPLARSSDESARQIEALSKHPEIVAGLNFNYRMNPLVQEMKHRVRKGEIGSPRLVHGSYLQDWLLFETDYNWRIEPEISGPSRVMADIGSHWIDSVQVVTGAKIVEVCADLLTAFPVRKKPKGQVETFAVNINAEYEEKEVLTEDYGAVLFRMDNGARGVFLASQVSPGRKCHLNFEIDGTNASLYWNQELADQMWMGFRDQDNHLVMRNPNLMDPAARAYTYLAAGHPEGWNDAMRANVYAFYKFVQDGKQMADGKPDFATFQEGHYLVMLVEAILESNQTRSWVIVK